MSGVRPDLDIAFRDILTVASRAPSAHNTQPWAVVRVGPRELLVQRSVERTLGAGDPTTRQATIGIGMFVEGARIAASSYGFDVFVENLATLVREPLLARLTFIEANPPVVPAPPSQLLERATHRGSYQPGISPSIDLIDGTDVRSIVLTSSETRRQIAALVGEALRLAMSLPAMQREIAALVHWRADVSENGMAIEDMVLDAVPNGDPEAWWLDHFDAEREAALHEERWSSSPSILVVTTRTDDPHAWIETGRYAMRVLTAASRDGCNHDIAAGPVEVPFLVPRLRQILGSDFRPQLVCRIGIPVEPRVGKSGRLPLSAFVTPEL